ncbi:MAG: GTPase, partial [Marinirhabdus sp.]|nr:GTPase [Marinirhabdus sp.]
MTLIFVYNAKAGRVNALLDTAHKVLQPETYPCALCQLTFGTLGEKAEWKVFRESSTTTMVFLHKDEFERQYKSKWLPKYEYPLVLAVYNNILEPFI